MRDFRFCQPLRSAQTENNLRFERRVKSSYPGISILTFKKNPAFERRVKSSYPGIGYRDCCPI